MPHELVTFFQNAGTWDLVFTGAVVFVWLMLLLHEIFFRLRLAFYKIPAAGEKVIPISVIIVERNEEENLKKNLPGWLSLQYPSYEVLVVDDFSEDNSLSTIGLLKLQYPRLKLTGLSQETRFSQKLSRNLALKAASYETIVFVSPSAQMPADQWIREIAGSCVNGKEVVIGYTAVESVKGFFNRLYRTESFFQQTESMACCLNGLPFVVNEENVAFRKQAYFDKNGFAGNIREEYLNLELVLNDIIKRKKCAILPAGNLVLRKETTVGKREFQDLLNKSFRLKKLLSFHKKMITTLVNLLRVILFPVAVVCVVIYPALWLVILVLLIILLIIFIIGIKQLQKRLKEPGIFLSSLVYGIISPYYRLTMGWIFSQRQKMKQ